MVDASHGNSGKDHRRQPLVAAALAEQVSAGENGLTGVMLESFLREGRQEPGPPATLTYGQSVTDACMEPISAALAVRRLADQCGDLPISAATFRAAMSPWPSAAMT
jgi:3-deoxy-7-phosphoheptulonate synthase